jgi:hypothetical protein
MKQKLLAFLAIATMVSAALVADAGANNGNGNNWTVPITYRVYASDGYVKGDTVAATSVTVPAAFRGRTCDLQHMSGNNSSVHKGTGLRVVTGNSSVDIVNVESDPGAVYHASGPVTLGDSVEVTLVIGESTIASVNGVLKFTCEPVPPTTTTEPPTTTTESPVTTTTEPPTTTTVVVTTTAPPVTVVPTKPASPAVPVTATPDFTG